jgi:hypothetical protein
VTWTTSYPGFEFIYKSIRRFSGPSATSPAAVDGRSGTLLLANKGEWTTSCSQPTLLERSIKVEEGYPAPRTAASSPWSITALPHIPVATASTGRALPSMCRLEEATTEVLLSSTALSQSSDRQQSMAGWRCDLELSLSSKPNIQTTNERPSQGHATRHRCRSGIVEDDLEKVAALQLYSPYKNARDAPLLSMGFGERAWLTKAASRHTSRLTPEL